MPTIAPNRNTSGQKEGKAARHTRRGAPLHFVEEMPPALSRSSSLDTLASRVPGRAQLIPKSGPRSQAAIGFDLPEGTVVRLVVLGEDNEMVDTLVDSWLPAGRHELCDLCLPNGAYKLRLETPNAWFIAGIMIG